MLFLDEGLFVVHCSCRTVWRQCCQMRVGLERNTKEPAVAGGGVRASNGLALEH